MKLRTGFVSNSSSSNFIVFGVKFTGAELEKAAKELNIEPGKYGDAHEYGEGLAKMLGVDFYPTEEFGYILGTLFENTTTAVELNEFSSVKKKLKVLNKEAKLYIRCYNEG